MKSSLQKVSNSVFGAIVCDYYSDGKGEFFMTRQQIGQALDYDEPNKRIDEIHSKHRERLDKFSTTLKLRVVEGKREVNREMVLYSAKGVYEICRWSRQPKADAFYRKSSGFGAHRNVLIRVFSPGSMLTSSCGILL